MMMMVSLHKSLWPQPEKNKNPPTVVGAEGGTRTRRAKRERDL